MTGGAVGTGSILHWKGFKFPDGTAKNKYFVIVGAQPGQNYLAVITTSVPKNKSFEAGGHPEDGYYHIPGGGRDWFMKDTWLLFEEPQELSASVLIKESIAGNITVEGHLRHDVANAICNCMRRCDDVSEHHKSLLGLPAKPPAKS
jgi:hypothetical protein